MKLYFKLDKTWPADVFRRGQHVFRKDSVTEVDAGEENVAKLAKINLMHGPTVKGLSPLAYIIARILAEVGKALVQVTPAVQPTIDEPAPKKKSGKEELMAWTADDYTDLEYLIGADKLVELAEDPANPGTYLTDIVDAANLHAASIAKGYLYKRYAAQCVAETASDTVASHVLLLSANYLFRRRTGRASPLVEAAKAAIEFFKAAGAGECDVPEWTDALRYTDLIAPHSYDNTSDMHDGPMDDGSHPSRDW